jgi:hypothetical protein
MADTSSYNGIDMANILSINGQDVPSGGGGVSESSTGVLYFEGGGFNDRVPDANEFFPDTAVSLYKAQVSTATNFQRLKQGIYHWWAIDDSNNLYSGGWANTGNIGRTVSSDAHELVLSLTNVDHFEPHDNGCWAIKTDGTLWWCGNIGNYANTGDTGQGTTQSSSGWLQYGSDTDWIYISNYVSYPYSVMAIKGGTGAEYLYSAGYNNFGKTGLGLTSGITKPFTRVKSSASVDWTETIAKVDIAYDSTLIVTQGGELFAIGEANYGATGQGNTTDVSYPVQVGTDTDWETPFAKARTVSWVIKTTGALYGSRASSSEWGIGPTTSDRTYRQIGTDTDYEELRFTDHTTSKGKKILFAKKNGVWYANWDLALSAGSFSGNTAVKAATLDNTWVPFNDIIDGNDIDVGINDIMLSYKNGIVSIGEVLIVATAAT